MEAKKHRQQKSTWARAQLYHIKGWSESLTSYLLQIIFYLRAPSTLHIQIFTEEIMQKTYDLESMPSKTFHSTYTVCEIESV